MTMGAIATVTDETFEQDVLRNPRPVLVEYWAPWCGPCRQLGPVLAGIAAEKQSVLDVVKINSDENPRAVQRYAVMLVPTMHLFTGGQLVRQITGVRSRSALLREFAELI